MKTLNDWLTEQERLSQGHAPHTPRGRLKMAVQIIKEMLRQAEESCEVGSVTMLEEAATRTINQQK